MDKLMLLLVIVLIVIAVAQIAKIYGLATTLRQRREEDISNADNRLNAGLMLAFVFVLFISFFVLLYRFDKITLPLAASKHGHVIDQLFDLNWIITLPVFFLVNFFLFYFTWKYARRGDGRKALYYPYNNKLELAWTVIPALALAVLIIFGLIDWNRIMAPAKKGSMLVQIYGKQFDWTFRYAGKDGKLGPSDYTLISSNNPLGIITPETIDKQAEALSKSIAAAKKQLEGQVLPDNKIKEIKDNIHNLTLQRSRVLDFKESGLDFKAGLDDKVVKGELHLPVDRQINLALDSRDVIHSAYMPQFRVQMNCVPGMTTHFKFTPTITTDSMRILEKKPKFDYMLLCNKVCGTGHYNMHSVVVIDTQKEFTDWLSKQKTFGDQLKSASINKSSTPTISDETAAKKQLDKSKDESAKM